MSVCNVMEYGDMRRSTKVELSLYTLAGLAACAFVYMTSVTPVTSKEPTCNEQKLGKEISKSGKSLTKRRHSLPATPPGDPFARPLPRLSDTNIEWSI